MIPQKTQPEVGTNSKLEKNMWRLPSRGARTNDVDNRVLNPGDLGTVVKNGGHIDASSAHFACNFVFFYRKWS